MNDAIENIKQIEKDNPNTVEAYFDYYKYSVPKIVFVGADKDAVMKGCVDYLEGEGWFCTPDISLRPTASELIAQSHIGSVKEMYEKEIQRLREERDRLNKIIDRLMK